ncbi:dUTP diphosphatase [Nodosilinea sp. FACHB-131]|uniref:dUTP diphosphatase n=1 Tax=Cyanophyceae TaxID=3028117 RepID=UPI00168934A5|nr:dUTP diphosphatase [Nodosilinea sp. FACHB-131]MBD1875980.1 dUTP diphosphatase [Nodosilinea sp. FACHB-131]
MKLKIKKIHDLAILPSYAHLGDAGLDLCSIDDVDIAAGDATLIHTGIAIELPPGTEAQIRPRSGLALKHSVTVLNTPGTIDEGYRGEVGVILINHGKHSFQVVKDMKIAQMVIKPVLQVEIEEIDELTQTQRGPQGFGSTGMS